MTEPTVYDAFHSVFPDIPTSHDEDMKSMPLDCPCGNYCRLAIKSAAQFLQHIISTIGDDEQEIINSLAYTTAYICRIHITG